MPPSQQAEQRIPAGRVFNAAGYEVPASTIMAPKVDRTVYMPERPKMPIFVGGNRESQIVPPSVSGPPSRIPNFPTQPMQQENVLPLNRNISPIVPEKAKFDKMQEDEKIIPSREQKNLPLLNPLIPSIGKEPVGIMPKPISVEKLKSEVLPKTVLMQEPRLAFQEEEKIQGPRIPMLAPDESGTMMRQYTAKIVPMEMQREEEDVVEVPIQPQKEIRYGEQKKVPQRVINKALEESSIMRPEPVTVAAPIMEGEVTPPQTMVEFTREERQQAIENVFNRMEQEAIDEGRRYYGLNDKELNLYAGYIGKSIDEARKDLEAKLKTNMKLKRGVRVIDLRAIQTKDAALKILRRAENAKLKQEERITGAQLTQRVKTAVKKFGTPMSSAEREAESAAGVDVNIPPASEPSLLKSLSGGLTSIYQGAKSVGQGAAHLGTELITGEDIPEGGAVVPVLKKSARKITSKAALKGAAFAAERVVGLPPGAVSAFI
jgi:hypothetical protein